MSSVFDAVCATCNERGPQVQRKPAGTALIGDQWGEFLIDHEYHDLRLVHEVFEGKPPE